MNNAVSIRRGIAALVLLGAFVVGGCHARADARADETPSEEPSSEGSAAEEAAGGEEQAEAPAEEPEEAVAEEVVAQAGPALEGWQAVLTEYVTDDGGFQYEALMGNADHLALVDAYIAYVAGADASSMERDDKLAFYINAYNALTVRSVIELWPVESVLSEDGFFDGRMHTVAGGEMTLNDLENNLIRGEEFSEPRIHFIVNCASTGCPWLLNEAITAANLEEKLDFGSRSYVQRTTVTEGGIQESQNIEWVGGDFAAGGGVRAFLVAHLEGDAATFVGDEANEIGYFEYDWSLNAR